MRLLLIAGGLPPLRCGVGDYTLKLADGLLKGGYCIPAVLTSQESSGRRSLLISEGRRGYIGVDALVRAHRLFRPDAVHIQYPGIRRASYLLPLLAKRAFGVPVVQTWHEHYCDCRQLGLSNLLGLDALVHVRDDLPDRLPYLVRYGLRGTPIVHIPNASHIRPARLTDIERHVIRQRISKGVPLVAFFGFAYPNKGLEQLFEIADPKTQHLVLICELDSANQYQRTLLKRIANPDWRGRVTVTGYLPEQDVATLLAAADAVVFPFPDGGGRWNTSVLAASASGAFVLTTTRSSRDIGFDALRNMLVCRCSDIYGMREGLRRYLGRRVPADCSDNAWAAIVAAHEALYKRLV